MDAQTSVADTTSTASEPDFKVLQVGMAVVNMEKMVAFYESVFKTTLNGFEVQGIKLYSGTIHGFSFVFAPTEIAGVVAEQSRHQFELVVNDIEEVAKRAEAAGGNLRDGIQTDGETKVLVVEDPDRNTIVFHQKIAKK